MANLKYNIAKTQILAGDMNLRNDTVMIMLVSGGYIPSAAHNYVSQSGMCPLTYEVAGANYSRQALVGRVFTQNDTDNRAELTATDNVWNSINAGTIGGAILFKDTGVSSSSPLIIYLDAGGVSTSGSTLLINWSTSGLIQFS
jgi:hypothetical protein